VRGDIVWVRLDPPGAQRSHVQANTRPGVILQSDSSCLLTQVWLVVPGTSSASATRLPHTVDVNPSVENGLAMRTIFLGNQLSAIDRSRLELGRPLGRLSASDLARVETGVKEALALR
jgi:mRNA-degrading endonuclease toxin of MazEF toxin-antitoxin module